MIAIACPHCFSYDLIGNPKFGWFRCRTCGHDVPMYQLIWNQIKQENAEEKTVQKEPVYEHSHTHA